MEQADTIINARWLVPVEPSGVVLDHHALIIRAGRIAQILPQTEAQHRYQAPCVRELNNHVLIPGLVNAHTHAAMALLRGLADDLPLLTWLRKHIWPAEQVHVSAEFVRQGSELAVAEMLLGGITCFNDMYFFPEATARIAMRAGIRAVVGMIVIDLPSVYAASADEYLSRGLALHDTLRNDPLVTTAFAPHAPYTVSERNLERIRTLADELDVPVHIHLHETAHEIAQSIERHGVRPLARLDAIGLLSPGLIAVHMTQLEAAEMDRLAESGAHIVHCPESNLKLASGFAPVPALLERGVNVALGTDGAASNNDLDMFGEMRMAALLAKGVAGDATALPAHHALHMATLAGAQALGLADRIGSLLPGKYADLVAVDLGCLGSAPVYNPISQLVYAVARSQVSDVWVAGCAAVTDGRLMSLDPAAILSHCQYWHDKIQS
ncbi:MAG: TRZ/ATZ family hydrolase [Nitrococcus mobilis]|nr:TRZ/ATZ family hydrolase [Nitrococcus mobilis]